MKPEIIWSDFAANELDKIFEYYIENAGLKVAQDLLDAIISEPNNLINNPDIGQMEVSLLNRENDYRYLVYKSFKIIYSLDIKNQYIKVADVFDTRQDPGKLKRVK